MKSPKDIAIFLNVRKHSSRCKNKMLRPFADSTLYDICLNKVKEITDYNIYLGAYEDEFIEKAQRFKNITIIHRSEESALSSSDSAKIFEALHHIPNQWVMWINPSHSFLTLKTIRDALNQFLSISNNSLTSVVRKKGWFYTPDGYSVTNKDALVDTKISEWLYETAHAFHIYNRKYMIENLRPWPNNPGDPYLFPMPEEESYDIDTEDQFVMVERLYERKVLGK